MNKINFANEQETHDYGVNVLEYLNELRENNHEDEWKIDNLLLRLSKKFTNVLASKSKQEKVKEQLIKLIESKKTSEEVDCCYKEYYISKLEAIKEELTETIEEGKNEAYEWTPKTEIEEKNINYMLNYMNVLECVKNSIDIEIYYRKQIIDNRKKLIEAYGNLDEAAKKVPATTPKEKISAKIKRYVKE